MTGDRVGWIDPRPAKPSLPRPAARRANGRRRVLVFDNGKLSPPYTHWTALRAPLTGGLAAPRDEVEIVTDTVDLLEPTAGDPCDIVDHWRRQGVSDAVLLLCDVGVTQPTIALAAAAERAGIPTVSIGITQAADLMASLAAARCPGMPVVPLPVSRLDAPAVLADAMTAHLPAVLRGLTADPATLVAEFADAYPATRTLWRDTEIRHDDVDGFAAASRCGDGLPLRGARPAAVACVLDRLDRDGDDVLIPALEPSRIALTARDAVVAAEMAGATPAATRLVIAALEAMAAPAYNLSLGAITSHPSGHLLVFSGPLARAAGLESGRGCLGPGARANLAVGRAVNLALRNVSRAVTGLGALTAFGSSAQLSYCLADRADGPLPPLNVTATGDRDASVVLVHKCEAPRNVLDHMSATPDALLSSIAAVSATPASNNAYLPSDLVVLLNPEHAEILRRAGWSRVDGQRRLWSLARNRRTDLLGRNAKPQWPPEWSGWDTIPVTPSAERIHLVVAGGSGPQSMVALPWGYARAVLDTIT
ncbi:hypothetical protein [Actinophytocola sp.]|uniref:hypothetical protein n=1 Tax=Actinophytocola sp. TaxID=1872138 RepID=UPI003D6C3765